MRKQLILTFSAILVVALLTVGFSSRAANTQFESISGEASALLATQGLTALHETTSVKETQAFPPDGETSAVELEEGDSTLFRGLSLTLITVQEKATCSTCLEAEMQLSTSTGTTETVFHEEGEVFFHEGYKIKISQIAPEENLTGVSRRVVLLFSMPQ
ncbi:MAG: hypothetical protein WDZ74_01335 [Candidatus Paceibacterota bacterium]